MKKKVKRELIEWTILISVFGGLYLTGLHTEVLGFVQRVFLSTGIITPGTDADFNIDADYNYQLEDVNGNLVMMSDLKGKTIFMNFWATWCPPCIAEMPDINSLYSKTGDEIVYLMISLDDEKDKARKFIAKKGFDFPIYFPASRRPAAYASNAIPTTFIISSEGKIATSHSGMAKYDTDDFIQFLRSL